MPNNAIRKRLPAEIEEERRTLSRVEQLLRGRGRSTPTVTVDVKGQQVVLPTSAVQHLQRLFSRLARGKEVAILSPQEYLTTQEAADLLHVSRPYLIGLLDQGSIPYHRLKSHRRIRLEDLLAFRERFDAERQEALVVGFHTTTPDVMVRILQEQSRALHSPPMRVEQLLDRLAQQQVPRFAALTRRRIELSS